MVYYRMDVKNEVWRKWLFAGFLKRKENKNMTNLRYISFYINIINGLIVSGFHRLSKISDKWSNKLINVFAFI